MPATRVVSVGAAVLGLAVAVATGWSPPTALGTSAIPPDATGRLLDGNPITAIVGDIDGDGVRELISLGPRDDDPVHLAVEVLEQGPDGDLVSAGSVPLTRMASVTEQLSGLPRPDENNLLQARVDEPARLVTWHEGGREHVLAMAIGTLRNARACCLSIYAVERGGDGIRLRLMTDTMRSADQVRAVDMDADGTDELVVTEPRQDADPNVLPIAVLKWTGARFASQSTRLGVLGGGPLVSLGDSDGLPGEELGTMRTSQSGATLHRIALDRDGRLRVDQVTLPFAGGLAAVDGPGGGRLVLGDDQHGALSLTWPAGRQAHIEERSAWRGVPVATLGEGANARVLKVRDGRLLDAFGPRLGTDLTGLTGNEAEARFRAADIPPYVGPLPGGMQDGSRAFIFRGRLLRAPSGGQSGVTVTDVSALPAVTPVGLFGRSSSFMALALPVSIGVEAGLDATREGGQLLQPAGRLRSARMVVADAAAALSPEADGGLLQPDPQGPVRVEARPDGPVLLAGGSFVLPVPGPPGTELKLSVGDEMTEALVPEEGVVQMRVDTDGFDDGDEVRVSLLAITSTGQGYGGAWTVSIHTQPPVLRATTPLASLGFDVGVSGRTAPEASLAVDGTPVPVESDGRFAVAVSAGLWPRDVQIVATDPLGNRTTTTISVVAPLDYRQLPWIPIVALLTILAGLVLYLRVPHVRPATASGPMTDATLEDLD
ncbi:MAG TPA: hypothetical protein VJY85_04195 [Candidatus Limnocylindria bacterium]|nr:hypothetical protein [Candidatus Limnocylindria bacterium]